MKEIKVLVITERMEQFLQQYKGMVQCSQNKNGGYVVKFISPHKGEVFSNKGMYLEDLYDKMIVEVEEKHNDNKIMTIKQFELIQEILKKIQKEMRGLKLEELEEYKDCEKFSRMLPIKQIIDKLSMKMGHLQVRNYGKNKMFFSYQGLIKLLTAFRESRISAHNCKAVPKQFIWHKSKIREAEERIWADIQADEKELLEDKIDEDQIDYEKIRDDAERDADAFQDAEWCG